MKGSAVEADGPELVCGPKPSKLMERMLCRFSLRNAVNGNDAEVSAEPTV